MEYGTTGYEGFRKGIQNQEKPFLKMSFHDALSDDALCDDALSNDTLRRCLGTMPCDNALRRCLVRRYLVRRCHDDALCDHALCDYALRRCPGTMPWDDALGLGCFATMPCEIPCDYALRLCLVRRCLATCLATMPYATVPCAPMSCYRVSRNGTI